MDYFGSFQLGFSNLEGKKGFWTKLYKNGHCGLKNSKDHLMAIYLRASWLCQCMWKENNKRTALFLIRYLGSYGSYVQIACLFRKLKCLGTILILCQQMDWVVGVRKLVIFADVQYVLFLLTASGGSESVQKCADVI